jgi:hypothetical protein
MFPGKTNRWILLRTLRDAAEDAEIRNNVQAVLAKWLGELTGWDPIGEQTGHIRVGPADNIRVLRIASERWTYERHARGREELPYAPLPMLVAGPWTSVEVEFDWRSQVPDIPWPVWTGGPVALTATRLCPWDCDWMLDEVGVPVRDSPPEVPLGDQIEEVIRETGQAAVRSVALPVIVAGVLLCLTYLIIREIT